MIDREKSNDITAGRIALATTIMVALATLTPYVVKIPEPNLNLIIQAQTTIWNGWLVVLGYYFGSTHKTSSQVSAMTAQAEALSTTAKKIPTPPSEDTESVQLAAGEAVKVEAKGKK